MAGKHVLKPLFDNVLIRPLEAEAKTASGIILPDSAKEKPQMGIVMAIGDGKIAVKVGQTVIYKKFGRDEIEKGRMSDIKLDGEELKIVNQEDILAIIS